MNFSKINELKHYDLNCNIFDVYSYNGLSMQELLCQFFTKINECVKTSNETIDLAEWLVNEGVEQEVAEKLTNCLNDGTFENLINVTFFENLNTKIDNVSSQLSQKANDIDVRHKSVLINEYDISDSLKQQINGNAPILQTIGDGSITPNKTTFINSINLFNKSNIITNKFVNHTNGDIVDHESYFTSDFIFLDSDIYVSNFNLNHVAFYDIEKKYISGFSNISTVNVPSNAKYIRFSVLNNNLEKLMFVKNELPQDYVGYKDVIDSNLLQIELEDIKDIENLKVGIENLDFIEVNNYFNKNDSLDGFYVNYTSGAILPSNNNNASNFILVEPNENYTLSDCYMVAFYNNNKNYISGHLSKNSHGVETITTPSNCKYLRTTTLISNKNNAMIVKGDELPTSYLEHGYKIPSKYIEIEIENDILINLPKKLYALVGEEFNIYFDNIINGKDTDYSFDVVCSRGNQLERCFRFVPQVKENIPITINIYKGNKLVAGKTSNIIVSSNEEGRDITRKIIVIGDSTTNNGICITKINENFSDDVMNIETMGTRGTGSNKHEGRSGWTAKKYLTVDVDEGDTSVLNAFYNPSKSTFDFSYYINNNNIDEPDYVVINLGINDVFSIKDDNSLYEEINNIFDRYDFMINNIKSHNQNIKICIALTIPPNYNQDAFGKAYVCNQNRDRYKRNNTLFVNELIKKYDNRESENIYLIPLHCNIDTKYNYGLEEIKVNNRNTMTYLSPVANGGVHPVESGYWQCADSYWYFLKGQEI